MRNLIIFILVMLSILLSTSCATKIITETVVPELIFPIFPEFNDYERIENKVIVPNDWIISLAEYKILITETEKNYNEIKELYNETE